MENLTFTFKIKEIKTLSFSQYLVEELIQENHMFFFNIGIKFQLDPKNSSLFFDVLIKVFLDKAKEKKLMELLTRISYEIEDLASLIKIEDGAITIPDPIFVTLNSISISTARGILSSKTEGTPYKGAILPILDPKKFLPKKKKNITN